MDTDDNNQLLSTLRDIRTAQQEQLALQREALDIQRKNFTLVQDQFERAQKLQDGAQAIQVSSAQMMDKARKTARVVVPMIVVALLAVFWLIVRAGR